MGNRVTPKLSAVGHVGLYAKDPVALAKFYQAILGMTMTGGSRNNPDFGTTAFLSSRPEEETHEIIFFDNPHACHTAFKVRSLAELRDSYRHVVESGLSINASVNHGVSLAFYFDDPEGNEIEIYWPTGLAYASGQPYAHPIDLTLSEEALLQDVADLASRVGAQWPVV